MSTPEAAGFNNPRSRIHSPISLVVLMFLSFVQSRATTPVDGFNQTQEPIVRASITPPEARVGDVVELVVAIKPTQGEVVLDVAQNDTDVPTTELIVESTNKTTPIESVRSDDAQERTFRSTGDRVVRCFETTAVMRQKILVAGGSPGDRLIVQGVAAISVVDSTDGRARRPNRVRFSASLRLAGGSTEARERPKTSSAGELKVDASKSFQTPPLSLTRPTVKISSIDTSSTPKPNEASSAGATKLDSAVGKPSERETKSRVGPFDLTNRLGDDVGENQSTKPDVPLVAKSAKAPPTKPKSRDDQLDLMTLEPVSSNRVVSETAALEASSAANRSAIANPLASAVKPSTANQSLAKVTPSNRSIISPTGGVRAAPEIDSSPPTKLTNGGMSTENDSHDELPRTVDSPMESSTSQSIEEPSTDSSLFDRLRRWLPTVESLQKAGADRRSMVVAGLLATLCGWSAFTCRPYRPLGIDRLPWIVLLIGCASTPLLIESAHDSYSGIPKQKMRIVVTAVVGFASIVMNRPVDGRRSLGDLSALGSAIFLVATSLFATISAYRLIPSFDARVLSIMSSAGFASGWIGAAWFRKRTPFPIRSSGGKRRSAEKGEGDARNIEDAIPGTPMFLVGAALLAASIYEAAVDDLLDGKWRNLSPVLIISGWTAIGCIACVRLFLPWPVGARRTFARWGATLTAMILLAVTLRTAAALFSVRDQAILLRSIGFDL